MGSLHIGEWHNAYRVPAGSRLPPGLDRDLDRLAPRLAESLAQSAFDLLGPGQQVILIPELAQDCVLDAACPSDSLVRHWSAQLAQSLARTLEDPASGVVRFASKAAFHAAFVADLVRGLAWGRWWYRGLAGLRALPPGAAIRTLVSMDPGTGRGALGLVDAGLWPALSQTLGAREAVRILWAWRGEGTESSDWDQGIAGDLSGTSLSGLLRGSPALAPPLLALFLLARWPMGADAPPGPGPIGLACWLAALHGLAPGNRAETLARLTGPWDPGAPLPLSGGREWDPNWDSNWDRDWLGLLALAPAESRAGAAWLLAESGPAAPSSLGAEPSLALPAPFGGMVWLLPALSDLLFSRPGGAFADGPGSLADSLPEPPCGSGREIGWGAADAAARLALAILAGDRGTELLRDPFWCAFLRLPPGLDPEDLAAWLGASDTNGAEAMERALGQALRRLAIREPVWLRPPGPSGKRGRPMLAERGSACPLHPGSWDPDTQGDRAPVQTPIPWRERLALTRALARDLKAIAASPILAGLPSPWWGSFACLAQGVLRRTANRIPGSALASLPYLRANVLGVGGEARGDGQGGWTLGLARPPLHVLLAINGMARLRLGWPGGRELAVEARD